MNIPNIQVIILSRGLLHDLQSNESKLKATIATSVSRETSYGFSQEKVDITYAVVKESSRIGGDFPEASLLARVIIPGVSGIAEFGHVAIERDIRDRLYELLPELSEGIEVSVAIERPQFRRFR